MLRPMRNTEHAFGWIRSLLRDKKISFRVTGGFAAHVHGSSRRLADIDFDVRDRDLIRVVPFVKRFTRFGPKRYRDAHWDLRMMTIRRFGQTIDICGIDTAKIFDQRTKQWKPYAKDGLTSVAKNVYGERTPIIRKRDLIAYKTALGRGVDKRDLAAL